MTTEYECPWNTAPNTIEEMMRSSRQQEQWEDEHARPVPYHWNIVVTRRLFADIGARLISIEMLLQGTPVGKMKLQ